MNPCFEKQKEILTSEKEISGAGDTSYYPINPDVEIILTYSYPPPIYFTHL